MRQGLMINGDLLAAHNAPEIVSVKRILISLLPVPAVDILRIFSDFFL